MKNTKVVFRNGAVVCYENCSITDIEQNEDEQFAEVKDLSGNTVGHINSEEILYTQEYSV